MKTNTRTEILAYIKQKNEVTPQDIICFIGKTPAAVYRHLKKLQASKNIYKIGRPPKVRYYVYANMNTKSALITNVTNWAASGDSRFAAPEQLCATRDVFEARSNRLINNFKKLGLTENLAYLLGAIVGEIGNNSFDHNIGQWRDTTGILFASDEAARVIIIADRGQGVLATLKKVRPNLVDSSAALNTAFTESISGRSPEQRGNGLKFVKKVIIENNLGLTYYSGDAMAKIDSSGLSVAKSDIVIPGTLSIITY